MSITERNSLLGSKKNLKWFESRIENFNSSAPYHINVLMSYKNNILNQYRLGNFTALKQERISAERTIRHLKQFLIDIERLREQVRDSDLTRFDKLIVHSRENINSSLKHFNDFYSKLEIPQDTPENRKKRHYYPDYEEDTQDDPFQKQIIISEHEDVWEAKQQKEIAETVEAIQKDVQTVNEIFHNLAQIVGEQKENVETIETQVENTHERVVEAEKELAQAASKINGAAYPLVGALLGSCVGGPIGFVAGLKIGTAVAVTCSVLGFSGGKALKMKQRRMQTEILQNAQEQRTIKS